MFAAANENSKPDAMLTDYVEGVTCDGTEEEIEAVKDLKGIAIDALGHLWSSEPKVFCEVGCLSPVWEVTYCVRCFNYDAEGDFTIKAMVPSILSLLMAMLTPTSVLPPMSSSTSSLKSSTGRAAMMFLL